MFGISSFANYKHRACLFVWQMNTIIFKSYN